jgi:hypothetical protein
VLVSGLGFKYHVVDVQIRFSFKSNGPPEALAEATFKEKIIQSENSTYNSSLCI